jgi:hypothetical protein
MVVLGISLGTRLSGIAVLEGGRLVSWNTHSFKDAWTEEKARDIASVYERYVKTHNVTAVVIKVPPLSHFTDTLFAILEQMQEFVVTHGCMVQIRTQKDVKDELPGIRNKKDLMLHAVATYPELSDVRDRELASRNKKYHTKMFEAVIVAYLAHIHRKPAPKE